MLSITTSSPKPSRNRKRTADPRITPESVQHLAEQLFGDTEHAKRVQSIAMAAVGVIHAASLAIHAIGRGMAAAMGLDPKHATKQVDRLIGNTEVALSRLFQPWVRFVVGARKEIVVALDWTDFDGDSQTTICLYLITRHGRATPLVWKTVRKSTLAGHRNEYEDEVIEQLHCILPADVRVTLLADRGFGDQMRYEHLALLGFDYIIRFRECILVSHQGKSQPARQWLAKTGRAKMLKQVQVTGERAPLPAVVLVHDKRMKDAWCLATSRDDLGAAQVTKLYGRRFTIEETFRDTKDVHFGMGLSATHIGTPARRDRLLMLTAIAYALLVLLGAAGERCGLDRTLKANTVKRRTLSLYNQGRYWYNALPNLRDERRDVLLAAYADTLREHDIVREVFAVL
jgi:hypothetical protein